ncbi:MULTISPECIES: helix-turn-helix domain-containing protein [Vibrio harveyi group]|uniref:HTH cro/C1-type domain-containing protein n=1 Tax=Vibrio owensii CAIM 1854 = LMG 25443 TaxID=1229493 RepID=A0A0C1VTC2_9VIBR|nr:helix-turn-helix transcriptional regulator [Vibrio owensii]KIF53153.1 hypothetical protein H735_09450 [Vibrio owensii CAIM 1854 = LMG 25443]
MPVKESMYFAPFLRTYRTEMDWSQTKLFEVSGVARRTITRAENGEKVSQEILEKLSFALGLTHWTELVENRDSETYKHPRLGIALKVSNLYFKTLWQSHVLTFIVLFYLFIIGNVATEKSSVDTLVRYCLFTSCFIVPLASFLNYKSYSIEPQRSLPLSKFNIEQTQIRKRYSDKSMIAIGLIAVMFMLLIQDKLVLASYVIWYLLTTGLIIKSTHKVKLTYQ